jgi:hypothetical protein
LAALMLNRLSIDENSLFEGLSRRAENPTNLPSSVEAKAPQKEDMQSQTLENSYSNVLTMQSLKQAQED